MKKSLITAMLFFSLCLLAGCEKVKTGKDHIDVSKIHLSEQGQLDESQSYFCPGGLIARAENGYYFIEHHLLKYYDNSTSSSIVVCTKANCDHRKTDCMAWMNSGNIYYYQGYLYQVMHESGTAKLVRMDKDGSNRQVMADLCNTGTTPNLVFCNGSVYYHPEETAVSEEERTVSIRQVSVNGGQPKAAYEYTGINPGIIEIKAYGRQVYFVQNEYILEEDGKNGRLQGKGIFCIDTDTGEVSCAIEGNIRSYCIDEKNGHIYYYVISEGLYDCDAASGEVKQVMAASEQSGMCTLSFDGNDVYMENLTWKRYCSAFLKLDIEVVGTIWVFDTQNHLKQTINLEDLNCHTVLFGDSKKLFIDSTAINGESGTFYINKEQLDKGLWTKL